MFLKALSNEDLVLSTVADRDDEFKCPSCKAEVTLKRGPKRVAHFAHKSNQGCAYGKGESLAHLKAKLLISEAFQNRGLTSHVEHTIQMEGEARRADVYVKSPNSSASYAIEIHNTNQSNLEIRRRNISYSKFNTRVIWVPIVRNSIYKILQNINIGQISDSVRLNDFEIDLFDFYGTVHFWEPNNEKFFVLESCASWSFKGHTEYWDSNTEQVESRGGFYFELKKHRRIAITSKIDARDLKIQSFKPKTGSLYENICFNNIDWPGEKSGRLALPENINRISCPNKPKLPFD